MNPEKKDNSIAAGIKQAEEITRKNTKTFDFASRFLDKEKRMLRIAFIRSVD